MLTIDGVGIGAGEPCRFIAELSNNHNGELDRALRLIRAAKDAGCEFVKFQAFTPDELIALRGDGPAPDPWGAHGWTMRALYEQAMTPRHWFPQLFDYARSIGILPFASVFGLESLVMLERLHCPVYKIAALDNASGSLYEAIHSTGKPIIVSARDGDIVPGDLRLYCPPGYPQESIDYRAIERFDGFSYHGVSPSPCVRAYQAGARIIEAHLMLADEPSALEASVSLTESQFATLIATVRAYEQA